MPIPCFRAISIGCTIAAIFLPSVPAATAPPPADDVFRRDNLIAWCIVPFDAKKRGPEERAAMLERLGLKHFAYDFRAEHVPTFEAEIIACKKHGVSLDAWWFPKSLNDDARRILEVCKRQDIHPQLWITGSGGATKSPEEQQRRIEEEAARIRPIAEAAAAQGMKVGLYNHGGWFGEPENQLALIERLQMPNVGIVYNLHHGHDHLDRFATFLPKIMPHLLALNLNGMVSGGDKDGRKILQLGQGKFDLELLRTIRASGYRGPIGILGHTQDDAEARLQDNLDGLDWLLPQLGGRPPAAKPRPRTPIPQAKVVPPQPSAGVHLKPVDGRLKTTLVDRSPNDVYLGVKVDADGNVFVGGREAVFVFQPKQSGGYQARREVLRFPPNSIIMGLEFRNDDLYVLTDSALYLVPHGRVRREKLEPQRILWGLPLDLHVSFHCLAWGPDGDLYLTHGDPLLQYGDWTRPDHWGHWTLYCGRENRPLPYTGQGAVLRMKPDGSDVRVVARGLRGPVGLAFDRDGNLFTNDNDHESRADRYAPSRLLHVVEGIDFAWPRGWMASKSPDRYDLIEPMCDLGRGVPCDLVYYDRPLLADVAGNRLLMCRWDRHSVTAYRPERRGSMFAAVEETVAIGADNCRPVGIAADRDGRLFVTALYMTGNMAAPECVSDLLVIERTDGRPPQPIEPPTTKPRETKTDDALVDARSDDLYLRQLATIDLAHNSSAAALQQLAQSNDEPTRLAAVLAVGRKLTVPEPHSVPPANVELFYPKGSSYFHRTMRFFGEEKDVDLADLGRIGSFTIAQRWAATKHSPDEEALFAALLAALEDPADRIRLQGAYFLSLLKDPRSEPLVEQVRRDVQLRKLHAAPEHTIVEAWTVGPFAGDATREFGPERGHIDLAAMYDGRTWQRQSLTATVSTSPAAGTSYHLFRVVSRSRQTALLTMIGNDSQRLWHNEIALDAVSLLAPAHGWLVDLQPGSNEFLVRATNERNMDLRLRATGEVEISLPEKLDSALLAERLRTSPAVGAAQPVPTEFVGVDWSRAAAAGDPSAGRRLFGTLGCAKCHAIVPDQASAGAPSLFEAKRRFTIPHLVESVLLPSRQVAELFRAQTFVTDDGRTLTGLVTGETADVVDLLLPDATRSKLAKKMIEERSPTQLSPMPQGLVKTTDELRHLLAYLLSDRPLPP